MIRRPPRSTLFPTRRSSDLQPLESAGVHCLLEAVPQRLAHQRVIGNLELARQILGAGELVREDGREQILRRHARSESTRLNSSHSQISYAVFCLKKNTPLDT